MDKNIQQEDEISLKELVLKVKEWIAYLWSKKILIIIAGLIGSLIGLGVSFIKQPQYKATLTFATEEVSSGGSLSGLAAMAGIDLGGSSGGAFSGDNLLEFLKSRLILEQTLLTPVVINGKKENLVEYYIYKNNIRENWAELEEQKPELRTVYYPVGANRIDFTRAQDSVLGVISAVLLKKNITVEKIDKKLSIIRVTCTTEDELFSKLLCETLVNNVALSYTKLKTDRSLKSVNTLQHKADSVKTEMEQALYGRATAADQNINLNPAKQVAAVNSQNKTIEIQILSTIYGEIIKNLEMAKYQLERETPLYQTIDSPILPLPLENKHLGKLMGILIGGFLGGFLICTFLIFRLIWKSMMDEV